MSDDANPRDAAISAFRQREAEAGRVSSEQARAEQEQSRRHSGGQALAYFYYEEESGL